MNYELAKSLKEAGFPQDLQYKRSPDRDGGFLRCKHKRRFCEECAIPIDHRLADNYCYFPTLSELIEACLDRFSSLQCCCPPYQDEEHWLKQGIPKGEWAAYEYKTFWKDGEQRWTSGSTPEIAVARLWLRLKNPLKIP